MVPFFLFLGGYYMEKTFMNYLELYIDRDDLNKIRQCDDIYLKSAVLVSILFKDRKDKSGKPYLGHLLRVSNRMTSLDGMVAGLLHDVVEDIPNIEFEDLLDIGIPENIVDSLRLITKEPTTRKLTQEEKLRKYNQEIDKIIASGDDLALELKIADMSDNYDPDRLKDLPIDKLIWFNKKYAKNLERLKMEKEKRKIKC